jgi:ubiquinone/menaquinone biosynthesis C-methylase UbiE
MSIHSTLSSTLQPEGNKRDIKAKYDHVGRGILSAHASGDREGAAQWILSASQPGLYWLQHKIQTMFTLAGFSTDDRLLEVGCTAGTYTMYLARDGYDITGLDISSESIAAARVVAQDRGLSTAHFVASDVDDMRDIPDNAFDGAFSFSTLRYLPDPVRSLTEIRRVLRPGARVVVDFPNKYCPWFEVLKFVVGVERHIYDHTYSTRQVLQMMRASGFVNVRAKRIIFFAKQFPGQLVSLYKLVDSLAERTPVINQFAGIIMCTGEKPTQ